MDLHDLGHNIRDGLHIASLSGAALAVIAGLGGLRDDGDVISFSPRLPEALPRVAFQITFGGNTLHVELTSSGASYTSREDGNALRFLHDGEPVDLAPGETVVRPLPRVEVLPAPEQPAGRAPDPWPRPPGAPGDWVE